VMMHRIGMHGEVGYLVFRHRQTNANPRSRGKWRQNACVCVCVLTCNNILNMVRTSGAKRLKKRRFTIINYSSLNFTNKFKY
jgi:hypothetical protein